jgi:FecR protein/Tetratricopeptide repeat
MRWLGRILKPNRACPPGWKLARSVSEDTVDREIGLHLSVCARCMAEVDSFRELGERARDMAPPARMTDEAREAISARLLSGALRPARRLRLRPILLYGGAAIGLTLAILVAVDMSRPPGHTRSPVRSTGPVEPAAQSRASIQAVGDARFARVQSPPDDVVRLEEGLLVIEVAPLQHGERFRVRTSDAEVEVRGTRFQVSAAHGQLLAVSVSHGRVEVRSSGGGYAVLEPGDEWVRGGPADGGVSQSSPSAALPSTPIARPLTDRDGLRAPSADPGESLGSVAEHAPVRKNHAVVEPSASRSGTSAQASFEHGWALLRQGDAKQAAALFAELELLAHEQGIAEDALYWRAVAVARTGDSKEAQRLFAAFLTRFPNSYRGGEAATALGWSLLADGDPEGARRAFERATSDPSPTVRSSALDGLRHSTPH